MNRVSNVFIPGVLSPNECEQFVQQATALLSPVNADMGENKEFPEIRSSTVRWMYQYEPNFTWVFDRILPLVEAANTNSFGFAVEPLTTLQFTSYYGDRRGQYGDHIDLFLVGEAEKDRKLSFVVQLSNPLSYVGGDLRIHCENHPHPTTMRLQGALSVFPSFLQHGVSPVTHGTRHSLVGWVEGPRLK